MELAYSRGMNASPLVLSPSGPPAITAPAADPATSANTAQPGGADSTFSVAMQNASAKPLRKSSSSKSSDGHSAGTPLPVTGNHSPPPTAPVPQADPRLPLAQHGAASSPGANGANGANGAKGVGAVQEVDAQAANGTDGVAGTAAVAGTDAKTGTAGATGTDAAVAEATATGGKGSAGTPATSFDTLVGPRVDDDASEDNGSSAAGTATAGAAQAAATAAAVAAADSGRSARLGAAAAGSAGAAGSAAGSASASSSAKGAAGVAGRLAAKVAGPSVRTPAAAGVVAAGVVDDDDAQVAGSAPVVTVAPAVTHDDGTALAASAAAQAAANPAGPAGGPDMAGDAGLGVTAAAASAVSAAPATVAALAAARAAASAASAQGGAALAASSGADKHVSAADGVSVAGAGAGAGAGSAAGVFPLNASTVSGAATDTATPPTLQLHAGVDSGEFAQDLSDRVTYLVGNGMNGARLQVNPPQLGPIELRIAVSGDHAQVWMTTHSAVTRDALESSSPKLREMLGAQGFGAVSVNISQRSFQDRSGQAQPYQRTASAERSGVAPLTAGANPSAGSRAPAGGLDAYA